MSDSKSLSINIIRQNFPNTESYYRSCILNADQIVMIRDEQAKVMEELVNRQLLDANDVINFARFQGDCQGQLKILHMLIENHLMALDYFKTLPNQSQGE